MWKNTGFHRVSSFFHMNVYMYVFVCVCEKEKYIIYLPVHVNLCGMYTHTVTADATDCRPVTLICPDKLLNLILLPLSHRPIRGADLILSPPPSHLCLSSLFVSGWLPRQQQCTKFVWSVAAPLWERTTTFWPLTQTHSEYTHTHTRCMLKDLTFLCYNKWTNM